MRKRVLRLMAVLFAMSLFATACGSDSAEDAVEAATDAAEEAADDVEEAVDDAVDDVEEAVEDAAEDVEEAGGAVDEESAEDALDEAEGAEEVEDGGADTTSTLADLEAEWAANRAALVEEIIAAGYGVEGTTLTGPGGWTVDLSTCPADWSDTEGIVDGKILIGHTTAQSGSLAAYGNIAGGMETYFNYVNENGGIGPDGLQIELITKDDGYVATQTQELVAELLQTEKPFYIQTLGSPNTFAVQGTLNDACVPQPLSMTGHQAWGDPVNFPWTTGMQMSYATESLLWGTWIEQNFTEEVTVAALVMDNDFGLAYEQGFERFAEQSDIIGEVTFVRHDPAAATLTNEITTLAAAEPDIFISMTAGNPCLLATQEAARAGITETAQAIFQPSVCKDVAAYMEPAGEAADGGWLIFGGGAKVSTDPQYADDTYISWMNSQIEAAGLDPAIGLIATGYGLFGWPAVEVLKVAAELPGGLTRTNYMIALRAFSGKHPVLFDGMSFSMNGLEDAYLVEGSDLSRFDYATQSWIIEGGIIDLDAQSPLCAWVAGEGC